MRNGDFSAKTVAAIVCLAAFAAAGKPSMPRIDVTSSPAGAKVAIDGELRGETPLNVFSIAPGRHLFHLEAPGHVSTDACVDVPSADGAFLQKHFELEREKALVFLRTNPDGAEVKHNGISLGTTPLFVNSLPSGETYVFDVVKAGYRPSRVQVRTAGRRPVVVEERLIIDSGTVECVSDPPGAEVMVNGIARGTSPVTVENVAKGDATVEFRLAGYRTERRQISVPPDGRRQTVSVKLKGLPATLKVVSSPEGARVFVDGDYQGKTPANAPMLSAGDHKIRIELDGHATQERTVRLSNGQEATESFTMASVLGRIEVTTIPSGVKITMDGHAAGTTHAIAGSKKSAVLSIEKVPAGERSIVATAPGCQDVSRKVKVPANGTATLTIALKQLFVPDTEIETVHGSLRRGILMGDGHEPDGIHLEVSPGVEQVFPHDTVRKIRQLKNGR